MPRVKLAEEDRKKILSMLIETELTCAEIGSVFDVSRGPVHLIQKEHGIKRRVSQLSTCYRKCFWCGKVFRDREHKGRPNRGKYCSKQCYTQWQKTEDNKGANHPNWKDDVKHEDYLNHLRKTDEWAYWRAQVYERDNFQCQLCGDIGGRLHPHHIIKKSSIPSLIFDVSNGITLCVSCHMQKGVHVSGGYLERWFQEIIKRK